MEKRKILINKENVKSLIIPQGLCNIIGVDDSYIAIWDYKDGKVICEIVKGKIE